MDAAGLRAAANAVLERNEMARKIGTICGFGDKHIPGGVMDDAVALAREWLRDHPADDGESLSHEWVRSVNPRGNKTFEFETHEGVPMVLYIHERKSGGWEVMLDGLPIRRTDTRGDVRRLLTALGVPLKG